VQTQVPTRVRRFLFFWVLKEARPSDVDKEKQFPIGTPMEHEGRRYHYWRAPTDIHRGEVVVGQTLEIPPEEVNMTDENQEITEAVFALDAGVTNGMLLAMRLVWFLLGSGKKARLDEIVKYFESPDVLPILIKRLVSSEVIKEENGVITLVEDEGWRLDYC